MAKKDDKKSGKSVSGKRRKLPVSVRKKDVFMMEEEAIAKARKTLDSIEKFMDQLKRSDNSLNANEEVMKLRRFHLALNRWYRDAERAHAKKQSDASRHNRLREFIMLCFVYS